jgi:hypothetical protein
MRHLRITAAVLSSLVVVAAAVGVAVATGGHSRPPLVLVSGGKVVSDAALAPVGRAVPYRYRLAAPATDLGSDAPVGRLEAPAVDAPRVTAMARAFGLHGAVVDTHPGWRVNDGAAQLTLTATPGGWDVAFVSDAGDVAPGSVPGSGASGAVPPPLPPSLPTETTPEIPARNLPSTARAEQIARTLLTRLGVADNSWLATTFDSSRDTVSCAAPPCAQPDVLIASRSVELSPTFQSVAVDGMSWNVEIGDSGAISSASGLWTHVRTIDRYPLRSVAAAFADLVAGVGGGTSPGPIGARELPGASPDHVIEPVTVSIDRVTLGYSAVPASADGSDVVDLVPTYVFTGRTSAGDPITQTMTAVVATAAPPPTTPTVVPMSGAGANVP